MGYNQGTLFETEANTLKKAILISLLCIGCVALLCATAGAWIWFDNTYTLDLDMAGDRQLTLEYGQNYEDPGATAQFYGSHFSKEPIAVSVTTQGSIDTSHLGTYHIQYTASHNDMVSTAYRTVSVVDTQAPEITLVTNPDAYTVPGQPYQEEGFSAVDNVDGELTQQVTSAEQDGVVVYTVTDASGNTATVSRQIHYHDPTPPELKLQGNTSVVLNAGEAYSEPGYTATDNCDGDITAKVAVSGGVDIYKPGTYVLTYTVADAYENTASATRTVTVLPLVTAPPAEVNPSPDATPAPDAPPAPVDGKVIYLTFDDGPGPYTGRLLDVLAKYGVKATFFVVNTAYIGEVARIVQEGHAVGIHTTTHRFEEIYASDEAFFNDLYTMQGIIEANCGVKTTLMRFPGGSSNTVSASYNRGIMTRLAQAVTEQGFQYFDWNVDSRDAGGAWDSTSVFNSVVNGIGNKQNSVVLQHDIKGYSVDAVENIIVWGLANGYTFLPLSPSSPGCHHGINN